MIKLRNRKIDYCREVIKRNISENPQVFKMKEFKQHGETSCFEHCVGVAFFSLLLVSLLEKYFDYDSLARGALFHDYFLYDWHEKDETHKLHGFRHPKKALENADNDLELNIIEKNIILRHMFPLVPIPPKYKEGIVVCIVDKLCAVGEVFFTNPYEKLLVNMDIYNEK